MGLILQILGLISVLASLVLSIIVLVSGVPSAFSVPLLIVGILLISIGRKIK